MAQFKTFYFNPLRVCCHIVWDDTGECVVIDPGCMSASEQDRLTKFIENENLRPKSMILTHGHFDHVMGTAFVAAKYGIPLFMHQADEGELRRATAYCSALGLPMEEPPMDFNPLHEGEDVVFGKTRLEVIHTPGHTQGGVCFYLRDQGILFSGDTLFSGSIGRTDMFGGDAEQLVRSINDKLMVLPDETEIYPGHGVKTTIEEERRTNPFLTL